MPHTPPPLVVITPGWKLGQAPASGPCLIETRAGISVGTARNAEDAVLFAAAPDLLAALQPFAELCELADRIGHEPGSTCTWRIAYNDLAAARAAIAKAEER